MLSMLLYIDKELLSVAKSIDHISFNFDADSEYTKGGQYHVKLKVTVQAILQNIVFDHYVQQIRLSIIRQFLKMHTKRKSIET